ncbi:hypothetical protein L0P73_23730, partial [[Clostridium] innocuum]|uniref:hypothetical protein n=1 Tax=Clostridium innocuum TaxID=1522 RepID=UPI001EDF6E92
IIYQWLHHFPCCIIWQLIHQFFFSAHSNAPSCYNFTLSKINFETSEKSLQKSHFFAFGGFYQSLTVPFQLL